MSAATQPQNDGTVSLIEHYLKWVSRRCCEGSRTPGNRREILTRLDRQLPCGLETANAVELEEWVFNPARAISTQATYWTAIASFYQWAFDPRDPWLEGENPMLWMPPRPKPPKGIARPAHDDQLRRILTEAAQPFRLWALIAAYQGLRCCEIAGLDREHVTERTLLVVRGKGGKPRAHDTHPDVWFAVKDLPPGPLAVDPLTGQRATARYVSIKSVQHFTNRLHIRGVSMHMLRHWLGVETQSRYRDARVTQELLGHESLSSTQIYTRATMEQQRAARSLLPRYAA